MRKMTRSSGTLRSTMLTVSSRRPSSGTDATSPSAETRPRAVPARMDVTARRRVRSSPASSSSPQPVGPKENSARSMHAPHAACEAINRTSLPQLVGADVGTGHPFLLELVDRAIGIDGANRRVDLGLEGITFAEHGADAFAQHGRVLDHTDHLEALTLRLVQEILGRELLGEGQIDAAIDQIGMDLIGILVSDRLEDAGIIFADILVLGGTG